MSESLNHIVWNQDSLTEQSPEAYERVFGFKLTDFKGLDVLEIGSGKNEAFARALVAAGAKSMTVLNPALKDPRHLEHVQHLDSLHVLDSGVTRVAGSAEGTLFTPRSFDRIIALRSVPMYSMSSRDLIKAYENNIEALRGNGIAYYAPVSTNDESHFADAYKKILDPEDGTYRTTFYIADMVFQNRVFRINKL